MAAPEPKARPSFSARGRREQCLRLAAGPNLGHTEIGVWAEAIRLEGEQMQFTYSTFGGLVGTDVVESLLRCKVDQPISVLAKWLVRRSVITMQWNSHTLLPMFQFDLGTMAVRAEVARILVELSCVLDDWEIAYWFVQPNGWLAERRPVELVFDDAEAVRHAARADRFVLRG